MSLPSTNGAAAPSRLFFGCASMGGRISRRESLRALAVAFDHGITSFDTARSYGYGDSERILGEFLRGKRQRVFLSTKCGIATFVPSGALRLAKNVVRKVFDAVPALRRAVRSRLGKQHKPGLFTPAQIRQSVELSLRELRTDWIDLLFLHDVTQEAGVDPEVSATLDSLKQEGKILRYGAAGDAEVLVGLIGRARVAENALQYPGGIAFWSQYPAAFPPPHSAARLRLGNQPFFGTAVHATFLGRLEAALGARLSETEFREILIRAPLISDTCDAIVTSMFSSEHIVQNARSLAQPTLDEAQIRAVTVVLKKSHELTR